MLHEAFCTAWSSTTQAAVQMQVRKQTRSANPARCITCTVGSRHSVTTNANTGYLAPWQPCAARSEWASGPRQRTCQLSVQHPLVNEQGAASRSYPIHCLVPGRCATHPGSPALREQREGGRARRRLRQLGHQRRALQAHGLRHGRGALVAHAGQAVAPVQRRAALGLRPPQRQLGQAELERAARGMARIRDPPSASSIRRA